MNNISLIKNLIPKFDFNLHIEDFPRKPQSFSVTPENILPWLEAYLECINKKKSSVPCTLYRIRYQKDLVNLVKEVKSREYIPSEAYCFIVSRPKHREIFVSNFRDRVIHQWVIQRLYPLFESRFKSLGEVSFSGRKNYGVHSAVKKLKSHFRSISRVYTEEAWVGKFDIQNFFMTIPKDKLLDKLRSFISENYFRDDKDDLLWLLEVILTFDQREVCEKRGRSYLWDVLPPSRSFFGIPDNNGLPIGDSLSQLLANFYLSFLDEYIISLLGPSSGYVRFMDDFVIVSRSKETIKEVLEKVRIYLFDELSLVLHPDKRYLQEVKKGVKFLGHVIKPGRVYISNKTVGEFTNTLRDLDFLCYRIISEGPRDDLLKKLYSLRESVNSYLGLLGHTNSYAIRTKLFNDNLGWFWAICETDPGTKNIRIKPEYNEKKRKQQTRININGNKNKKILVRKHRSRTRRRR